MTEFQEEFNKLKKNNYHTFLALFDDKYRLIKVDKL